MEQERDGNQDPGRKDSEHGDESALETAILAAPRLQFKQRVFQWET